jgi:hypothetical protein
MSDASPNLPAFLSSAARLLDGVLFVVQSLPNVQGIAVEQALRQLDTVVRAYQHLKPGDCGLSVNEITELVENANELRGPLEQFTATPSVDNIRNDDVPAKPKVKHQGDPFRPSYDVDLDDIERKRWLGASWDDVAKAQGVSRRTLYNHMKKAGRPTARPYTAISDEDLDAVVSLIKLEHPFAGAVVVSGHLSARRLIIPHARVQASLRRIDPIGVMLRYAAAMLPRMGG